MSRPKLKICAITSVLLLAGLVLLFNCSGPDTTPVFPGSYKFLFVNAGQLYWVNSAGSKTMVTVSGKSGTFSSPSFYYGDNGSQYSFIFKEGDSSHLYVSENESSAPLAIPGYPEVRKCRWRPPNSANVKEIAVAVEDSNGTFRVLTVYASNGEINLRVERSFSAPPDIRWNIDGEILFIMERDLAARTGDSALIFRLSNGPTPAALSGLGCGILAMTSVFNDSLLLVSQLCPDSNYLSTQAFDNSYPCNITLGQVLITSFAYNGGTLFYSDGQNLVGLSPAYLENIKNCNPPLIVPEMIEVSCTEVLQVSPDGEWVFYLTGSKSFMCYKMNEDPNNKQSVEVPLEATGLNSNLADIFVLND